MHVGGQNTVRKVGCPKKLANLIHNGSYNPETLKPQSTETLKGVCNVVEIPIPANTTKVYNFIAASLYLPYSWCIHVFHVHRHRWLFILNTYIHFCCKVKANVTFLKQSLACSGGKVFKNCHHQVCLKIMVLNCIYNVIVPELLLLCTWIGHLCY